MGKCSGKARKSSKKSRKFSKKSRYTFRKARRSISPKVKTKYIVREIYRDAPVYDVNKIEELTKQNQELNNLLGELIENKSNPIQTMKITAKHQLEYYKECIVSLEAFKVGDVVKILPCGHFLSEESFKLLTNHLCPLCRHEF